MKLAVTKTPSQRSRLRSFLRSSLWSAFSRMAMHGLYTGELEDHWFNLSRVDVTIPGLGSGFDGAKIAHITDLHCSPIMRQNHLRRYIEIINRMEVDFVVLTGDFITASTRGYVRRVASLLSGLAPAVGSLACLGNHDYGVWHPLLHRPVTGMADYVEEQLASAGVNTLRNECHSFRRGDSTLNFVGLGDYWTDDYDPTVAFNSIVADEPVLALCHNPEAAAELANLGARYIFSGHTHGRVLPDKKIESLLLSAQPPAMVWGEYELANGSGVYINRGIGGVRRARNHFRPEIALFTLHCGNC